jgi:hypothetical protein
LVKELYPTDVTIPEVVASAAFAPTAVEPDVAAYSRAPYPTAVVSLMVITLAIALVPKAAFLEEAPTSVWSALYPNAALETPVVLLDNAFDPNAEFVAPVESDNAYAPTAVQLLALLVISVFIPTATLPDPMIFAPIDDIPTATLSVPVVLASRAL